MMYLFGWDEITGKGKAGLLYFIENDLNVDLGDAAEIETLDDGSTIKITSAKNTLLFKLNDEKTRIILKTNGVKIDEFIAKTENGKLNIYKINEIPVVRKYFSKMISIGIPALILLYVFYLIIFNVPVTYTIDIGSKGDTDPTHDAYIRDMTAQGRLSLRMSIEDDTFRIMNGSPVYFYITPKNSISNHTNITVELKFKGDSDLDIGVYKKYAWKPLFIRNLENYTPVKQFGNVVIYAKDDSGNYTDYENISEWISGNIPGDSTIGLYDYEIDSEILMNRFVTYENEYTEINQTFRGTLSFFIYLNDSLNLTFGKQDTNWYNGSDEYSVELYDINGNLLFNDTIPDDGIISNSSKRMSPQFKSLLKSGITEGLYELRLVNIKGENEAADSTITSLRINTDKIITQGTILPLNPAKPFFDLRQNTTLRFYAWHSSAVQNISIRGETDKEIVINKSLLGKWVPVELPEGSYNMEIKGDLYISGANFAFTNDSIFHQDRYVLNKENSEWIITSNYQVETDDNDWITAKKVFEGSDLDLIDNKTMGFGLRKIGENEEILNGFKIILTPK